MARPRKDQAGPSATQRITAAYWELLEEEPFGKATVAAVLKRSGVSPNTFYYHFEGFQELMKSALDETLDPKLFSMIVARSDTDDCLNNPDLVERFHRVVLYATSGSGELVGLLRQGLLRVWLQELGLQEDDLSEDRRQDLRFILAGVVSLLGSLPRNRAEAQLPNLQEFFNRPLGKGILDTMDDFMASNSK